MKGAVDRFNNFVQREDGEALFLCWIATRSTFRDVGVLRMDVCHLVCRIQISYLRIVFCRNGRNDK